MIHELSADELRPTLDPATLGIETTESLQSLSGIIGQPRAVAALEFGLGIQERGFNVFVAGPPGTGKMTAVQSYLLKLAKAKPTPSDWCYLNNFDDPYQPQVIALPAGRGRQFQQDMRSLIDHARREIPKAFESDDYTAKRGEVQRELDQERESVMLQVNEHANRAGFAVQVAPVGIAIIPIRRGRPLKEAEFEALPAREREEIQQGREAVDRELQSAMKQLRARERAAQEELQQLDRQVALYAVGGLVEDLREKYQDVPAVTSFIEAVQKDLVENIDSFKGGPAPSVPQPGPDPLPGPLQQELAFRKYQVNVVVDNGKQEGAPVVVEPNPSYSNLFGRIEKETHYGALYTDLTMIKGGSLHRANGGYLVLPVEDLLRNLYSWDALKVALRGGEIQIEELGERLGYMTTKSLRPGPIPLDVKVVLIGSPLLYYLFHDSDEQFPELFKVKAEFDGQMDRGPENVRAFMALIHTLCDREQLKHLDQGAVIRLLEHSSRLAEDQTKLSTHFGTMANLIREAHFWAQKEGAATIAASHISRALEEKVYRSSLTQARLQEMTARGSFLIDTKGAKVGQVNGLSVISLGDYDFGRPSRITASLGPGRDGIVDIEREVELGGPLHSKGVLILGGYLREKYAADYPLTLAAQLVFEQSYEGVEGDSASSAELYALLSALARLPIKQSIAVTGSVNQNGQVQAIGGVNEKIEGFFDLCRTLGLTGEQGVLIPQSNVQNLVLREDVVQAVKRGEFHVWGVETIDEGIGILTGVPAGERDSTGRFAGGTVNDCVDNRLKEFVKSWRDLAQSPYGGEGPSVPSAAHER